MLTLCVAAFRSCRSEFATVPYHYNYDDVDRENCPIDQLRRASQENSRPARRRFIYCVRDRSAELLLRDALDQMRRGMGRGVALMVRDE